MKKRLILIIALILVISAITNGNEEYSGSNKGKIVFVSRRDGNGEIYVINDDGTELTRITNSKAYDFKPIWSPDGTRILYRSRTRGGRNSWNPKFDVYVCNADGTGHVRLGEAYLYDPVWSPDGEKVLFISKKDGNEEIYVANADGSGIFRLTNNKEDDDSPSWSPDGSKILFRSKGLLYLMDPDGGNIEQLVHEGSFEHPKWSPDGKYIAFLMTGGSCHNALCIMDYEIKRIELLGDCGPNMALINHEISWSPDGSKIAVSWQNKTDADAKDYDFSVAAFDVENRERIFAKPFVAEDSYHYLEWSSDNRSLLFRTQLYIAIINTRSNSSSKCDYLRPPGIFRDYSDPHWSPDGTEIIYVGNNSQFTFNWSDLQIISPDGKVLRTLTDTGKDYEPDWFGY